MIHLDPPAYVPRCEGAYNMHVRPIDDGKWIATCVRTDNYPTVQAVGDSPAHAMALCAEGVAYAEDECLQIEVGAVMDKHCRCHDITEAVAADMAAGSPADVETRVTHRIGVCCLCATRGPKRDERGFIIPHVIDDLVDAEIVDETSAEGN
jgi:hypothetical protein